MQSNSFKPDEVVSSRDAAGNGRGPSVVVRDHLATSPSSIPDGTTNQARLVNLEPVQSRGIGVVTVAVAVRHVSGLRMCLMLSVRRNVHIGHVPTIGPYGWGHGSFLQAPLSTAGIRNRKRWTNQ